MTSYFIITIKSGSITSTSLNIKYFTEKIFNEDLELREKLNNIISRT